PFVSGKDSLNNEYRAKDQRLPVIPTLVISAFGTINDAATTVDMALKTPGNLLYQVGATHDELLGSHYATLLERASFEKRFPQTGLPQVHFAQARVTMRTLGAAIRAGIVQSCHDLSEGGLAVAAAEMALAGQPGLELDLAKIPRGLQAHDELATILLFSESATRFLVEVTPEQQATFERFLRQFEVNDFACIGSVTQADHLLIYEGTQTLVNLSASALQAAWKGEIA
ncbi:MAG: AIR synthase-related protein, partial [Ktedonobacteraceae bacterium]